MRQKGEDQEKSKSQRYSPEMHEGNHLSQYLTFSAEIKGEGEGEEERGGGGKEGGGGERGGERKKE